MDIESPAMVYIAVKAAEANAFIDRQIDETGTVDPDALVAAVTDFYTQAVLDGCALPVWIGLFGPYSWFRIDVVGGDGPLSTMLRFPEPDYPGLAAHLTMLGKRRQVLYVTDDFFALNRREQTDQIVDAAGSQALPLYPVRRRRG